MHRDGVEVDPELARRLILAQLPDHAPDRPLREVPGGTDNVIYRLSGTSAARFPRRPAAAAQVAQDAAWLARIAPHVRLDVPRVRAVGSPGLGYPFPWAVTEWLEGDDALTAPPVDEDVAAATLAGFVRNLRRIPAASGPPLRCSRPLAGPDAFVREMLAQFRPDEGDPVLLEGLWDAAVALRDWEGPPLLVHADLHPLNILTRRGRIVGVIDWGTLSLGDPAQDLLCAWTLLAPEGRAIFRDELRPDPASWARGRAYAFAKAVMAIPYYRSSNPRFRDAMRRTLAEVLPEMSLG